MTERIDVFYSRIDLSDLVESMRGPAYHKYLIYTDKTGNRRILRAGPDHHGSASEAVSPPGDPHAGSSYGPVRFYDGPFRDGGPDYKHHSDNLGEPFLTGDDLSQASID